MRAWLLYSLLRVLLFAVPFVLLLLIRVDWWIAAILAAAIGFFASYIFLGRLRDQVALSIAKARETKPAPAASDEAAEDDAAR